MLAPPQPVLVSSRAVKGISITKNRNFREDLKFFLKSLRVFVFFSFTRVFISKLFMWKLNSGVSGTFLSDYIWNLWDLICVDINISQFFGSSYVFRERQREICVCVWDRHRLIFRQRTGSIPEFGGSVTQNLARLYRAEAFDTESERERENEGRLQM